jgi:D-3-phosphoglycerate dehydrogenase
LRKVLLVDAIDPRAERRLADAVEIVRPRGVAASQIAASVRDADGIIVRTSSLPADVLAAGKHLRVIGKHGAGLDNIDVAFATRRGIAVVNTPGANAAAVAEFTLACVLLLLRPIVEAREQLRSGGFSAQQAVVEQLAERALLGRELASQRMGIVGWGAVGRRVGAIFAALGARVSAYDPYVQRDAILVQHATPASTLDALLESSDVVSVHVAATPETTGLIGEREIRLLQPHAILINTSRGSVVDEDALADALHRRSLRAAALDVFRVEPPPLEHPLLQLDNAICTPHVAGATIEATARMADEVVAGVLAVLAGETPASLANREALPLQGVTHDAN